MSSGLLFRIGERERARVTVILDGEACTALDGDTVLTAVLTHRTRLRETELRGEPRAGFCLMGACQDCWIWTDGGRRVRACSTPVTEGMVINTNSPFGAWLDRAS
ncbi:(2Fe-2S)-binding protein [Acuticoccus sediminis]|uniref:(2Fe-2S)-binding protein n=1 Tax=Acuticoccus sediminis TaxID=2184697 RepID=UPI001CFCB86D|nr:(2Fe-2S)-binding protein [Acuticoccus sediminis]